ncbi:MAG: PadR family transcriptional regulator [Actinomycetota bacterium]
MDSAIADGDLALGPFQTVVLAALIGLQKQCAIQELCDRLQAQRHEGVSPSVVYRTIVRLEERGLVECAFEGNRRGRAGRPRKLVSVTPAGRRKLQGLRDILEAVTALAGDSAAVVPAGPPPIWEPGAFLDES